VFHFLPRCLLSRGVDADLVVQLYTSWLVLVPGFAMPLRALRRAGGCAQIAFMVVIASSGNFAFLNHLTLVPPLACLDDVCFEWLILSTGVQQRRRRVKTRGGGGGVHETTSRGRRRRLARRVADAGLVAYVAYRSAPVVANLASKHQVMNATFDPLRLVNTYGAFGSVGTARFEPIVSLLSKNDEWHEVDFPCKPGRVDRRPCFSAPYHYRLDWNIWFLGFPPHAAMLRGRERWLFDFLAQLLSRGRTSRVLDLIDSNSKTELFFAGDSTSDESGGAPFADATPVAAKVDMYRYEMAAPLWQLLRARRQGKTPVIWWRRTFKETLVPPVAVDRDTGHLVRYAPQPTATSPVSAGRPRAPPTSSATPKTLPRLDDPAARPVARIRR